MSLGESGAGAGEIRTGTACGKVILLGEHAVVYGIPAIAVGIERGVRARAQRQLEGPSRLRVHGWDVDVAEDEDKDLGRAFRALLDVERPPHRVQVDADVELPPAGGLGCSAAIGVAIARAVDPDAPLDRITARAMAWERIFHGNPSGVDAAVSASGGCIQFDKALGLETVPLAGNLVLCIGHTGIGSSTKTMVEAVARLRERRPEIVEKAFDGIHSLVRNARLAIEAGDRFALGRLMDLNQMILSGLFVSTEEIEHMCELARTAGAHGAKLTGAGGGGCVVALVSGTETAERVIEAWRAAKFESFHTRVSSVNGAGSTNIGAASDRRGNAGGLKEEA